MSEPGAIGRAPGALELVRGFVNTINLEKPEGDALTSPAGLQSWLAEHGLLPAGTPVSGADVNRARALREALRALLRANNGLPLDPAAVETVNRIATETCLRVELDAGGTATLTGGSPGVNGALGRILGIMFAAQAGGTWARLKSCHNTGCRWAFYDFSKNRSGTWCSMTICGSRLKARAYRRRRNTTAPAAPDPPNPAASSTG